MFRISALVLVSCALLFQSSRSNGNVVTMYDLDTYQVYSTVLPLEWPIRIGHAKEILILNETRTYKMCLQPDEQSDKRIAPAIADYVKQNARPWLIQRGLDIQTPYRLISQEELTAAIGAAQWDQFYKKYPDSKGWIDISAAGFNADKTVAVVYVGHHCGALCGGGDFHVLEKKESKWVPLQWKGNSCSWVS